MVLTKVIKLSGISKLCYEISLISLQSIYLSDLDISKVDPSLRVSMLPITITHQWPLSKVCPQLSDSLKGVSNTHSCTEFESVCRKYGYTCISFVFLFVLSCCLCIYFCILIPYSNCFCNIMLHSLPLRSNRCFESFSIYRQRIVYWVMFKSRLGLSQPTHRSCSVSFTDYCILWS